MSGENQQVENFEQRQQAMADDLNVPPPTVLPFTSENYILQISTGADEGDGTDDIAEISWVNDIGIEIGRKTISGAVDDNLDQGTVYGDEDFSREASLGSGLVFGVQVEEASAGWHWLKKLV